MIIITITAIMSNMADGIRSYLHDWDWALFLKYILNFLGNLSFDIYLWSWNVTMGNHMFSHLSGSEKLHLKDVSARVFADILMVKILNLHS